MSKTLLIVDDDQTLLRLYVQFFDLNGYTVLKAESGNEAIRILESAGEPIDAIISDIRMPDGDGFDLLSFIRNNELKIPTFVVSGYAHSTREEILELGATQYYEKPIRPGDLIKSILTYL